MITIVTGTDTGVGKTIAVAALAATRPGSIVVKPVQTGIGGDEPDPYDAETVAHLSGAATETWVALDEPLAPDLAARRQGARIPTIADHAADIARRAGESDLIVEGAGGLLVRLDSDGGTLLDLAALLAAEHDVEVVVVARAGLGTLNHTQLTVEALRARGIEPAGLVVGAWPNQPGVAETLNREELPSLTGVPLVAVLPDGAGSLSPEAFRASAPLWFPTK